MIMNDCVFCTHVRGLCAARSVSGARSTDLAPAGLWVVRMRAWRSIGPRVFVSVCVCVFLCVYGCVSVCVCEWCLCVCVSVCLSVSLGGCERACVHGFAGL